LENSANSIRYDDGLVCEPLGNPHYHHHPITPTPAPVHHHIHFLTFWPSVRQHHHQHRVCPSHHTHCHWETGGPAGDVASGGGGFFGDSGGGGGGGGDFGGADAGGAGGGIGGGAGAGSDVGFPTHTNMMSGGSIGGGIFGGGMGGGEGGGGMSGGGGTGGGGMGGGGGPMPAPVPEIGTGMMIWIAFAIIAAYQLFQNRRKTPRAIT
jgi:hypothetical protein